MNREDWRAALELSSIAFRQFDDRRRVIGGCSGCIVRYGETRFVLSVRHALILAGGWAVEVDWDQARGDTRLYGLGPMTFLKTGSLSSGLSDDQRRAVLARLAEGQIADGSDPSLRLSDVDFAFTTVPDDLAPRHQEMDARGYMPRNEPKRDVESDLSIVPDACRRYGFYGQAHIEVVGGGHTLSSDARLEMDMEYVQTVGDKYAFRLSHPHPGFQRSEDDPEYGDHYYEGCSGAPILDDNGRLVALLTGGDALQATTHSDIVYGLALPQYRRALDIEILQARGPA